MTLPHRCHSTTGAEHRANPNHPMIPNRRSFVAPTLRLNLQADPRFESRHHCAEQLPEKLRRATASPKLPAEPACRPELTPFSPSAARLCPGHERFRARLPARRNLRGSDTSDPIDSAPPGRGLNRHRGSPPKSVQERKAAAER